MSCSLAMYEFTVRIPLSGTLAHTPSMCKMEDFTHRFRTHTHKCNSFERQIHKFRKNISFFIHYAYICLVLMKFLPVPNLCSINSLRFRRNQSRIIKIQAIHGTRKQKCAERETISLFTIERPEISKRSLNRLST